MTFMEQPSSSALSTLPDAYFRTFIYFLAFSSGFSIMTIELLGGRILAPYFGSSVHIWGSIITVFMLSLSLGYLLGGKLSTMNVSLKRYGLIFISAGITVLPMAFFSDAIMNMIFLRIEDTRYGSLLASMALFFIPTVILGMISPYSVRLLVSNKNSSGQTAGVLYFVSTLGSALGTLFTSFYFVLWFNVNTIILSACALLAILGAIALCLNLTQASAHEAQ